MTAHILVDADFLGGCVEVIRRHGGAATHVNAPGLGAAQDEEIAEYIREHCHALLTGDFGFADIRDRLS